MARRDPTKSGTTEAVSQSSNEGDSPSLLGAMIIAMVFAVAAAAVLAWWFGIFPFHHVPTESGR
jgi:hypothetical protein